MKNIYFLLVAFMVTSLSFGQVFITELADPNDNLDARYIELYNAGATPVDLSTWRIDKYTNASATVSQTLALTGTIPAGGFYLIASNNVPTAFFTAYGFDPDQWDAGSNDVAGSNGDDNLELHDGTSVVDQFGVPGQDGTNTNHEFEDGRAERKASVTAANATWDVNEWNIDNDGTLFPGSGIQNVADMDPGSWVGTTTTPLITVSSAITGLDYFEGSGPSAEGTFTVEGINLTANISVTAPTNFEVSLMSGSGFSTSVSVSQVGGTAATTTIYTRLIAGLTPNTYTGDVTAASAGATDATVALEGTVTASTPQITVGGFVSALNYIVGSGPSNEDNITVEGLFLTTGITVVAPANFEVSLTSGAGFAASVTVPHTGGTVATTDVFVRLASGLAVNSYSGDITVSSTGVTDETVAIAGNVFGPPTNSLVLTAIYDGTLSGAVPRGVEIFVLKNIADLSLYGLGSANNGGGTDGQEFTFPAVSATAGSYIYVTNDAAGFTTFFGFAADYTSGSMVINGDDAIELFENGTVIDTFGDINADGTGTAWEYLDSWAYRVSETGPDGATFVLANWTFGGINVFGGVANNAAATTPMPIGTYANALSIVDNTIEGFGIYPNPATNNITITTRLNQPKIVEIFNILGKQVMKATVENTLNVSSLQAGVYIVKVTENNIIATKKLLIK